MFIMVNRKEVTQVIGYRLKQTRKAKHMTQTELAELSGVSRMTIAQIERGATETTSSAVVVKLAKALGVTTDFLLCMEC